jgi:hypothetical protein
MIPRVVEAAHVRDYILRIRFSDGTEGDIDLESELTGAIFEPLRDAEYFQQFSVNADVHTVTWPNGADFAPEFLYEQIKVHA